MPDKEAKKINYELIPELDGPGHDHRPEPYLLMDEIRLEHHDHLSDAKIAMAWRKALNPDVDGHLVLGKCVKASDLQRELVDYDFVILLNWEVWHDPEFTTPKKKALLDHELCHAEVARDKETGDDKFDERGRRVWRTRKHDIEEFTEIVQRHGCYKRDLEKFAETLLAKKRQSPSLFPPDVTVSMGVQDENGKMKYTEPIPHSEFVERCDKIGKSSKSARAH
jgi:hypothetical protein